MTAVVGSARKAAIAFVEVGMLVLLIASTVHAASPAKPFGFSKFSVTTTKETEEVLEDGGAVRRFINKPYTYVQAGGHPWGLTTAIGVTSEEVTAEHGEKVPVPTRDPKDIVVDLPNGFLADPQAVPRCPLRQVLSEGRACPPATQVGVGVVRIFGGHEFLGPIVNLTPETGQSAEFGLENESHITYVLTGHVIRTGSSYGLTAVTNEIPMVEFIGGEFTFWGVPADPSHDVLRGLTCTRIGKTFQSCNRKGGLEESGIQPVPFLTMPGSCTDGPGSFRARMDSWEQAGIYQPASSSLPAMTKCDALQFSPDIQMEPDTLLADEPVGLGVNLKVPQVEEPTSPETPQIRDATVTLPSGMSIGPGSVDGIEACNEFGPEGINIEGPESEEVGQNGESQLAAGHCPDASIVGTAEAETPLLPAPVKGHVYLARPGCGVAGRPACTNQDALDGNLYQLYLELGGTGSLADSGVNLKVRIKTEANPVTGQLTAVSSEIAQLPFSELRMRLNGGPKAPLNNPWQCGAALTTADFVPWSGPGVSENLFIPGTADATASSFFNVEGCDAPARFAPTLAAGTTTPGAAKYSAFEMELRRSDREQYIRDVRLNTPPGLLAMLSRVPLCDEGDAEAGSCSQASKIGTVTVATGAGSHPFEIGGTVYLTGPYEGAPFGLSVVTAAVAGPFNLGLVVVRGRIDVDRSKASAVISFDESGPHAIPQVLFGVPLRLQRIVADISRPNFMFNPTNCLEQHIEVTLAGSQGSIASPSVPFAVSGCRSLSFRPHFTVETEGRTSRQRGASLDAKLSYPATAFGSTANVASVKVSLPKQLPSRLSTLQKACPAAVFERDPGRCSAQSVVGIARTTTPVLSKPLYGPVYFVSHGGEEFPSLIIVLEGDDVRVDLVGTTFISKAGITSSTFKSVPDVPVRSFELYLPEGRGSALAANGSLCRERAKLVMPTIFVGQNGVKFSQKTKIAVAGCKPARTGR